MLLSIHQEVLRSMSTTAKYDNTLLAVVCRVRVRAMRHYHMMVSLSGPNGTILSVQKAEPSQPSAELVYGLQQPNVSSASWELNTWHLPRKAVEHRPGWNTMQVHWISAEQHSLVMVFSNPPMPQGLSLWNPATQIKVLIQPGSETKNTWKCASLPVS